jgi:hypothetical protein
MPAIERFRIPSALVALVLALACSTSARRAHAQESGACPVASAGCVSTPVEFHWREGLLDAAMLDSGWVPSGSPLQVRVAVLVGGETEIDLAGTTHVWWPSPLSVAVPGTPASGRLVIDYGIEVVARVRFEVEVAGIEYDWEGDIPTGGVPTDLRLAAEHVFDSFLLPPQMPRPVTVEDTTERASVVGADLGSLIDIPGASGGFSLDAEGSLRAAYRTERIEITDALEPILTELASVLSGPDPGRPDFGAAKDLAVAPFGVLDYDGAVVLHPTFYVEIAGRRFDLPSTAIELPVVQLGREVVFDPAAVHVALPDARIEPRALDFGAIELGASASDVIRIRNEGEAPLTVTPREARPPFAVAPGPVTIAPRSARAIEISFAPLERGAASAMLFLETDDPDQPLVVIQLDGEGAGAALLDGGSPDAGPAPGSTGGGCSCRAGSTRRDGHPLAAGSLAALLALVLVGRRRRPRIAGGAS